MLGNDKVNIDRAKLTQFGMESLFDWYTPQLMKASLGDITTNEHNSKKANSIIIVQSDSGVKPYGLDDNKKPDKELIKNAVSEEFCQAFELLKQTKLPICFIRGIPHYDEGYRAQVAEHYIFLYFFFDHNNKKSVLVVDPQGSKFGDRLTDQNEKAIDEEFVDIVCYAVKKSEANLYVSKDVIQQDGRSCGPVSVELARAFYGISGDKEKLFKVLKASKSQSNTFISEYKLCKLGTDIIPQSIINDFNTIRQVEFTGSDGKSHYESIGGEEVRRKHCSTATLVNKKNKHLKKDYFISHIKPFLIKLGANPNLLSLEKLCPSFRSGIITGAEILNQSKVQVGGDIPDQGYNENIKGKNTTQNQNSKAINNGCISSSDESIETLNTEIVDDKSKNLLQKLNSTDCYLYFWYYLVFYIIIYK